MKRVFNFRIAPLILASIVSAICVITFCSNSLILALVLFAFIALICGIFIKSLKKIRVKLIICILTFFIFLGLTTLTYERVENTEIYSQNSIIEGDVDMLTECDERGMISFEASRGIVYLENIRIDGRGIKGKAYAYFADGEVLDGLAVGDRIKFKGNIAPQNLVVTDSYSIANYRNGVYHYIYCGGKVADEDFLFLKTSTGANIGDRIKLKIKRTLYSNTRSDTASFLYAMTFGDKSGLDTSIKSAFTYTGTAHVFAVSGLHVGMLASAILFLFKRLKLNNKIARLAIMAIILASFCALCDFSPSTIRAAVMTLLLMLSKALGRRNDGISSMSVAAILILSFKPLYLFDLGFLMSFFAVMGIFTLYKPLKNNIFKKLPRKLGALFATSIAVNLALLPLMMSFFDGETLLFIIANLLLLPIVGICFPIYFALVLIASSFAFMGWSLTAVAIPFTLVSKLIGWISRLPTFVVNFDSGIMIVVIGLLAAVALSEFVFINKKAKRIAAIVIMAAIILSTSASLRLWGTDNAYVCCYTDAYESQFVLVDNAFGGNYLIVNGKLSSDSVDATLGSMQDNKFSKIDGIIIADEVDEYYLTKLQMYANCSKVYRFDGLDFLSDSEVGGYVVEKGLVVAYVNLGEVDVIIGDCVIKVLAEDYFPEEDDFDVLVTYAPTDKETQGKYVVCDVGYKNSLENYVSGTFTFEINNDKIKVGRFWRN